MRAVVQRVLDELEARQADGVERQVIGAAGIADRHAWSTPRSLERREPRFEDRPHRVVALQVDAADLAAAVVEVEVAGELGVLRLELHRLRVGEMLLHVGARAEAALLLAAPQPDADGAVAA